MKYPTNLRIMIFACTITFVFIYILTPYYYVNSAATHLRDKKTDWQDDEPLYYRPSEGYLSYDTMMANIHSFTINNSSIAMTQVIAKSWEGRDVVAIKISDNVTVEEDEPSVLIMGAHHGNEQASAIVPYYFARFLLDNYNRNNTVRHLVDSNEIWIVPIVNPDGYVHDTRKNRRPNYDGSYGVDLNRNYWYHWGLEGASDDPSHPTYHGPYPFSEPETRGIRFLAEKHMFVLSASYHTYSSTGLWVHPWGFDYNVKAEDHELMEAIAKRMATKLGYSWGQSSDPSIGMYPADGDSDDWLYGNLSTLAFTVELKATTFDPPENDLYQLCTAHALTLIDFVSLAADPYMAIESGVEGYVKDANATPISNVQISLYNVDHTYSGYTNAEGYYFIRAESGTYNLLITAVGYVDVITSVTIDFGKRVWYNVTLMLMPTNHQQQKFYISGLNVNVANVSIKSGAILNQSVTLGIVLQIEPKWNNATVLCDLYLYNTSEKISVYPMNNIDEGLYGTNISLRNLYPGQYGLDFRAYTIGEEYTDNDGYLNNTMDFIFEVLDDSPPVFINAYLCYNGTCSSTGNYVIPIGTNITFKVTAQDSTTPVSVIIKITDNNEVEVVNTTMTINDSTYIYIWDTSGMVPGQYYVEFLAIDGYGNTASSGNYGYIFEINLTTKENLCRNENNAPFLYSADVTPEQGSPTTEFIFSVVYRDLEGDAPAYVYIWIDGNKYEMYPKGTNLDYSSGVEYQYKTLLPEGSHSFKIVASDGEYTAETPIIQGPEVRGNTWRTGNEDVGSTIQLPLLVQIFIVIFIVIILIVIFYNKISKFK